MIAATADPTSSDVLTDAGKALDAIRAAMRRRAHGSRLILAESAERLDDFWGTSGTCTDYDYAPIHHVPGGYMAGQLHRPIATIKAFRGGCYRVAATLPPRKGEMFARRDGSGVLAYLAGDASPDDIAAWLIAALSPTRVLPADIDEESPAHLAHLSRFVTSPEMVEDDPEAAE